MLNNFEVMDKKAKLPSGNKDDGRVFAKLMRHIPKKNPTTTEGVYQ